MNFKGNHAEGIKSSKIELMLNVTGRHAIVPSGGTTNPVQS
jgi:hypothetical protein